MTSAHVTRTRLEECVTGVNPLTLEVETEEIDTGCKILTFNYDGEEPTTHTAKIIAEDIWSDLSLLSFESDKKFQVAMTPEDDMFQQIRVFDEVFAIGCQLGQPPIPTFGIVSQIMSIKSETRIKMIYVSTAQILPGSSGGGLYRKYGNHYYLIGIPNGISVMRGGHFVPHMSHSVSMETAKYFIDDNSVSYP